MVFPKDIYLFIFKLIAHFYLIYTGFTLSRFTFKCYVQKNINLLASFHVTMTYPYWMLYSEAFKDPPSLIHWNKEKGYCWEQNFTGCIFCILYSRP